MSEWLIRAANKLNNKMMQDMVSWFVTGDDTDDHKCGHCSMRTQGNSDRVECTVVGDSNGISKSKGTCVYWAFGKESPRSEIHDSRMTYETAGYMEQSAKVNCGTCRHLKGNYCALWQGDVVPQDCCTAYEPPESR